LPHTSKRIDIWWRGKKNGDLMVLFAYLMTENGLEILTDMPRELVMVGT